MGWFEDFYSKISTLWALLVSSWDTCMCMMHVSFHPKSKKWSFLSKENVTIEKPGPRPTPSPSPRQIKKGKENWLLLKSYGPPGWIDFYWWPSLWLFLTKFSFLASTGSPGSHSVCVCVCLSVIFLNSSLCRSGNTSSCCPRSDLETKAPVARPVQCTPRLLTLLSISMLLISLLLLTCKRLKLKYFTLKVSL